MDGNKIGNLNNLGARASSSLPFIAANRVSNTNHTDSYVNTEPTAAANTTIVLAAIVKCGNR